MKHDGRHTKSMFTCFILSFFVVHHKRRPIRVWPHRWQWDCVRICQGLAQLMDNCSRPRRLYRFSSRTRGIRRSTYQAPNATQSYCMFRTTTEKRPIWRSVSSMKVKFCLRKCRVILDRCSGSERFLTAWELNDKSDIMSRMMSAHRLQLQISSRL